MTVTGFTLGAFSLLARPHSRRKRIALRDVLLGGISAIGLYGIFQLGDRMTRALVPGGGEQINQIYALKRLQSRPQLMARLTLIIAPAEELFWRGFLQGSISERWGGVAGALASAAAYGGAHLASGNFTLIGAATVAGAFWGGLRAVGATLGTLIVSHVLWDNWIFLIAPTSGGDGPDGSTPGGETTPRFG
jgi:membrane protease YdiL (CAAX protease family)